jgi:16S rRNA (cytosine967-C5)-methyltransferase
VHRDDAFANIVLPRLLRDNRIVGRDAALATELAYGALRSEGQLDAIIEDVAGRPMGRIDPPARDSLRLGAYQLLHTRVPAHAAVATTVDLVRSVAPGAVGFANAVMRRLSEHALDDWLARVAPPESSDPVGHLALVHSHPQWIVRAFGESLGVDPAQLGRLRELGAALAADNERPWFTCARDPGGSRRSWPRGRWAGRRVFAVRGLPPRRRSGGTWRRWRVAGPHVQDEGSQLVAVGSD